MILIAKCDPRMNESIRFGASGHWERTCHPVYTVNEIPVGLENIVLVYYQQLPRLLLIPMTRLDHRRELRCG